MCLPHVFNPHEFPLDYLGVFSTVVYVLSTATFPETVTVYLATGAVDCGVFTDRFFCYFVLVLLPSNEDSPSTSSAIAIDINAIIVHHNTSKCCFHFEIDWSAILSVGDCELDRAKPIADSGNWRHLQYWIWFDTSLILLGSSVTNSLYSADEFSELVRGTD